MNEAQKHSKVEMEILKHEHEMMHKVKLKKVFNKPLKDKIKFIISESGRTDFTVEEMIEELKKEGLYKPIYTPNRIEVELKPYRGNQAA